jgi:hypothetical protein
MQADSHTRLSILQSIHNLSSKGQLKLFKEYNSDYFGMGYYHLPLEKAANDAVDIISEGEILKLYSGKTTGYAGWKNSPYGRIATTPLPADVVMIGCKYGQMVSQQEINRCITFSKDYYKKIFINSDYGNLIQESLGKCDVEEIEYQLSGKNKTGIWSMRGESTLSGLTERVEMMTSDPNYENYNDDLDWIEGHLMQEADEPKDKKDDDDAKGKWTTKEPSKNGVNRKRLYIMFIEWAKKHNPKNTFGNLFDSNKIFDNELSFVPHDLRYFYMLANPTLCTLPGDLVFFSCRELDNLNKDNAKRATHLIFAATEEDFRVYSVSDRQIYMATDENGQLKLGRNLAISFDVYLQALINQGEILNPSE